jgi:hypothetical protein
MVQAPFPSFRGVDAEGGRGVRIEWMNAEGGRGVRSRTACFLHGYFSCKGLPLLLTLKMLDRIFLILSFFMFRTLMIRDYAEPRSQMF